MVHSVIRWLVLANLRVTKVKQSNGSMGSVMEYIQGKPITFFLNAVEPIFI